MLVNEKNIDISGLTEEECKLILLMLAYSDAGKYWREFKTEITTNRRFFPKSVILDRIHDMRNDAVYLLQKGEVYYRARLFHSFFLEKHKKEITELKKTIVQYYPDMNGKTYEEMSSVFYNPFSCLNRAIFEKLETLLNKNKRFWGYNAKDSDAPPCKMATSGRANPLGISYLYLSDSVQTAIMEVRPIISQEVSVAKIKIKDNIKIFDFCKNGGNFSNMDNYMFLDVISRAFSEPCYGEEIDYLPTQFLCEYIKELGFEGIRYYSSLNKDSRNIVLFSSGTNRQIENKNYRIVNSKVYLVKGYSPDVVQVAPWKDNKLSN